jgi:D-galactonate transporter
LPTQSTTPLTADQALIKKVGLKLLPFLFLLYVIAYLDRVNVGFAKLQLKTDLHFTDAVYGMGAGIFFIGYFLFEVPSNLILQRVGARRWIARIMISWGIIAVAMMFIRTPGQFYTMRFLLGLGEAGFFPGIILYLTYWFTAAERARVVAIFMTATAFSQIVGQPVSGWLLELNGMLGLKGWQWLFLVEGLPSVLLGFAVLRYLPDGPRDAKWLDEHERTQIAHRLELEHAQKSASAHFSLGQALRLPQLWLLCAVYLTIVVGNYGVTFWLPSLVDSFKGFTKFQVGLISAIPYIGAACMMVLNGVHSDRTNERRFHYAVPAIVGAGGLFAGAWLYASGNQTPVLIVGCITIAASGMASVMGPFWSFPPSFLGGAAAAGGIAFINSVGNLGGFAGPYVVGCLKDSTKSFSASLLFLACSATLSAFLVLFAVRPGASSKASLPEP